MSKRLAVINNGNFADEDFGISRDGEARKLSNFGRWLTNDSSVQCAIFQDDVLYGFQLLALQHVAAMAGETRTHCVIHGINDDNRLLGSTNYAVIEGFGHQD